MNIIIFQIYFFIIHVLISNKSFNLGNDEHDDEHNDDHNHNHDHDRVDNVHAVKPASRPDSVSGSEFGSGSQQSVEGTGNEI